VGRNGQDQLNLKVVVPATLVVILVLLFLNFRRLTETLIVMLSVPFALTGGAWLIWWLGYNMSVAVAVGFIALGGGCLLIVNVPSSQRSILTPGAWLPVTY
jgi:Cu/Ag efflux pump CusA